MNGNLKKHVAARDWEAAPDLLDQAVIGSRYIREYGQQYDPTQIKTDIPKAIRLGDALASYEAHVEKNYGGNAKEDYTHLSEHSHPSSLCLQQYHEDIPGQPIRFKEGLDDASSKAIFRDDVEKRLGHWLI